MLSQHSQSLRFWTNQNAGRRFDPDHPEFPGVYKPAQPSTQQDSANRLHRDSFSGSGLSSPALQRSHRDSFSESPSVQLNKEISLTDSKREARIAGGSRSGIVYSLPCAARPDTRLEVDAAPPKAAALSRAKRPPHCFGHPGDWTAGGYSLPRIIPEAWIALDQAPHTQTAQKLLVWGLPAEEELTTPRPLV